SAEGPARVRVGRSAAAKQLVDLQQQATWTAAGPVRRRHTRIGAHAPVAITCRRGRLAVGARLLAHLLGVTANGRAGLLRATATQRTRFETGVEALDAVRLAVGVDALAGLDLLRQTYLAHGARLVEGLGSSAGAEHQSATQQGPHTVQPSSAFAKHRCLPFLTLPWALRAPSASERAGDTQ